MAMPQRFLTLADVAEALAVSVTQVRTLVRSGELRAIQVGGRNQWRVEDSALEEYIAQQYERTRARIEAEQQ
ncbi:helix-turn-helix domain-containing protein [Georgenia deserti]|uniref:Helix-turn-helix domain-containing protein n=1 Tax=Georgenia deserti TaxID=2093781 RepID=A0ABW4L485_9MICO